MLGYLIVSPSAVAKFGFCQDKNIFLILGTKRWGVEASQAGFEPATRCLEDILVLSAVLHA